MKKVFEYEKEKTTFIFENNLYYRITENGKVYKTNKKDLEDWIRYAKDIIEVDNICNYKKFMR